MNLNKLLEASKKPNIYTPGTSVMWTDDHISKQLLDVHLNPDLDLASRRKSTIETTVEWIKNVVKGDALEILDLGCGPGLYCKRLAENGHKVTGIDFSKNSIEYAKRENLSDNLDISYRNGNYLELSDEGKYDLVILVFTDLGVLHPNDRGLLLTKIYKALKPGGTFIFDVLRDKDLSDKVAAKSWEVNEGGFWCNFLHLALSNSYLYEEEKVILFQHLLQTEGNDLTIYRFWTHFFSHYDLDLMLDTHQFKDRKYFENIIPSNDMWSGDNVTFCVAKK